MLNEGDILNERYYIRRIIGSGGSGCVYLATDVNIGKYWAVKEVNTRCLYGNEIAESEIQFLKSFNHPMFPRITDAWKDENSYYIVSDYIEGISLGRLIESGALSKSQTFHFFDQIAQAIIYLHKQNPPILYLDLKPDNILIKPDGRISLIDFGISRSVNKDNKGLGTRGFAAPEQYKSDSYVTVKTDIYAFGISYYCCRSGKYPDMYSQELNVKKSHNLTILEKWFVLCCIRPDPEKRIDSMIKVHRNLLRINISYKKVIIIFFSILITVIFAGILISNNSKENNRYRNKYQEIMEASASEGYSSEDLRWMAICANSGELSLEEEEYCNYEIGRCYFEKYEDYREAKRFFELIDGERWPQKEYYIKLCELQTGFEYENDQISRCLFEFEKSVMMMPRTEEKYKNLLFIAFCYGQYFKKDSIEWQSEKRILNEALNSLSETKGNEKWIFDMKQEIMRRLHVADGEIIYE